MDIRGRNVDDLELPMYSLTDAARYLKIHPATLRSWLVGRTYRLRSGAIRRSSPIIAASSTKPLLLSFYNLVEANVLSTIRQTYGVNFRKIRITLEHIKNEPESPRHVFATKEFLTDRRDLFIEEGKSLVCTSQYGQQVIKCVFEQLLERIDRDEFNRPRRVYPFITRIPVDTSPECEVIRSQPKSIVIDPFVSFGNPVVVGTGVPTRIIAGRFSAGEDISILSDDYDIEEEKIKEALEYEGIRRAA